MKKLYTVKLLEGVDSNARWERVWSGAATSEKDAKRQAVKELRMIAEEE